MNKLDVAREQLVTALDLFLNDRSPVSVHSLAGNAREILERLCRAAEKSCFTDHALQTWPELERKHIYKIFHQYRNAFKHSEEGDEEILEGFSDLHNDHMIFITILDYLSLTGKLTIAMQVFYAWYLTMYPNKLVDHKRHLGEAFAELRKYSRQEQKRRLRLRIEEAAMRPDVAEQPHTER